MSDTDHAPVKMNVRALVMDPVSNMPVIILEEPDRGAFLPIWIGVCEANAIAIKLAIVTEGKRVNLPGGLPIIVDGHVIGGIGVGSTVSGTLGSSVSPSAPPPCNWWPARWSSSRYRLPVSAGRWFSTCRWRLRWRR